MLHGIIYFSVIKAFKYTVLHSVFCTLRMFVCVQVYLNVGIFEEELEQGVTTHQELFPHSMLSVVAEFIPFSDHNQSPRNMYQCQMSKNLMSFVLYCRSK